MTERLRQLLISFLGPVVQDQLFGDGMEHDYVLDGVQYIGLRHMTAHELLEELVACGCDDPWHPDTLFSPGDQEYELYRLILAEYPTDPNGGRFLNDVSPSL